MKPAVFTSHALERMETRGATQEEVEEAIRQGSRLPASRGRWQYRMNITYNGTWASQSYAIKQVVPFVAEEADRLVVITVYVFYF